MESQVWNTVAGRAESEPASTSPTKDQYLAGRLEEALLRLQQRWDCIDPLTTVYFLPTRRGIPKLAIEFATSCTEMSLRFCSWPCTPRTLTYQHAKQSSQEDTFVPGGHPALQRNVAQRPSTESRRAKRYQLALVPWGAGRRFSHRLYDAWSLTNAAHGCTALLGLRPSYELRWQPRPERPAWRTFRVPARGF